MQKTHLFCCSVGVVVVSLDGGSLTGGKDSVAMKQEDDSSFTVKIQGAGLEAFEMQVTFSLDL